MLEAIRYKSGCLEILDQLKLPMITHYESIKTIKDGYEAIKTMKVRGAPAISIVAALSVAVELSQTTFSEKRPLLDFVTQCFDYLCQSRPTAVNLERVAKLLTKLSKVLLNDQNVTADAMSKRLISAAETLLETDIKVNRAIGEYGGKHIVKNCRQASATVLTHCNTGSLATAGYGTALGVIRWLNENNLLAHAFCTETRPYNQGSRLTAYELVHDKIPATLICDSMVAALMQKRNISAVVVGADRVVANGDTANKIGTYQIAVCAKHHNIPFYVACPRSTFDFSKNSGEDIKIEQRPAKEMMAMGDIQIAAEGINCWNPSFDVTSHNLITGGIITEIGVFDPVDLKTHQQELSDLNVLI